jgi:hypothetical protein
MYYKDKQRNMKMTNLTAIDGLRQENADLGISYLGNGVKFVKPVDDPWFLARKEVPGFSAATGNTTTWFHADSQGRAMGCTYEVSFTRRFATSSH